MQAFAFRAAVQANKIRETRKIRIEQSPCVDAAKHQHFTNRRVIEQMSPTQRLGIVAQFLALLLSCILLIVYVCDLKIRTVRGEIQVQRVMLRRREVEAHKQLCGTAFIMQALNFRRIEIATSTVRLRAQEHADSLVQIPAGFKIRANAVERASKQRK